MSDVEADRQAPVVLIVEDERPIGELFETLLRIEGFEPHLVVTSADARSFLERRTPDIVILDILLPDESGLELCRHIRRELGLDELPILIVSALTQTMDIKAGMQAGGDVYLEKPVPSRQLTETVRRLLGLELQAAIPSPEGLELEVN